LLVTKKAGVCTPAFGALLSASLVEILAGLAHLPSSGQGGEFHVALGPRPVIGELGLGELEEFFLDLRQELVIDAIFLQDAHPGFRVFLGEWKLIDKLDQHLGFGYIL
jgi:hypothetical protein